MPFLLSNHQHKNCTEQIATNTLQTFVNTDSIQSIHFNHKVIAEENKSHNWEEIDENDTKDSSE